jgi:hypothetical protein
LLFTTEERARIDAHERTLKELAAKEAARKKKADEEAEHYIPPVSFDP